LQFSANPAKAYELLASKERYASRVEHCKRHKDDNENYILVPQAEKEKYDALLDDPMHGCILDNIYDFMNMVFGKDPDTDDFWEQILLPYAAQAFGYPIEKLSKAKANLHALLFAFISHFGLAVDFDASIELGKTEKPFLKQIKDLDAVSKVYGLRNLPYRVLAERYKEYRRNGKNELALKTLKMKMAITRFLEGRVDTGAVAEIAEILLDEGLIDLSIEKTREGLVLVHPLHAETIKFYCILLRAFYEKGDFPEGDKYCFRAISTLDFHWGTYHPLHATIYSILAYLLIKHKDNLEQAEELYKASLICCTRVLGPNHLHTAEVYMDYGRLYLKMNNKEQALASIEKAYLIYESSIEKSQLPLANAALQLATILEDQRRFKEALPYARKAVEVFQNWQEGQHEMYVPSVWLVICIAYSLNFDDLVAPSLMTRCKTTARSY
jgi:tetratricopeptide (TPR) repeat protein